MKVINYLLGYKDLKIVQDNDMFNFSLDSVLLPNFVTINKKIDRILDIGCGNAPIPLILSTKTNARITGVEIQKEVYDLAIESIKINKKDNQITIINKDINDYYKEIETDSFDVITCNPPYFKVNEKNYFNLSEEKILARHEVGVTLSDVFCVSKKLLKNGGNFAIVHRPERLLEIVDLFRSNGISPKRLQFVYEKLSKDAILILVEGQKTGKPGLKVEKPFIMYNEDGSMTEEYELFCKEVRNDESN